MADGYRGLLAPWIGGAANSGGAAPTPVGYRGLLAFWSGGAANFGEAPPEPPAVVQAAPTGALPGWRPYEEPPDFTDDILIMVQAFVRVM